MTSMMRLQSVPYQVLTGKWRISGVSNVFSRIKTVADSFRFEDLPAEVRPMIYRFFFAESTLLDTTSAGWQDLASILGTPSKAPCSSGGNNFIYLLLVSKRIYREAAQQLDKIARVVAGPEKITKMISDGCRIASSQTLSCPALKNRVGPEDNIRSLTIFHKCTVSDTSDHSARGHARVARKLRITITKLKTAFPQLKQLVIHLSHYQDLISGGAVVGFVSPLCCLHRLRSIQFVAGDVQARTQARAAGEQIQEASRLRIQVAVLSVLTDIFTKNCDTVSGKHLHENGKCIYRGSDAGVELQRNILAPDLRKKHRVKVAALM